MLISRSCVRLQIRTAAAAEGLRPSACVVRVLRRSFGAEVEPHPLTARELLSRVKFPQHLH
jgi:hypothetical protein